MDNSLDGYFGRNTQIGILGTSLTNPYLKEDENYISLTSSMKKQTQQNQQKDTKQLKHLKQQKVTKLTQQKDTKLKQQKKKNDEQKSKSNLLRGGATAADMSKFLDLISA